MGNQEFTSTNSMSKKQTFKEYHIYYIDSFQTEFNNTNISHLYVADKKITLNCYIKVSIYSDDFIIFEFDYGDEVPRKLKGFKTKEMAQREIDRIKGRVYV